MNMLDMDPDWVHEQRRQQRVDSACWDNDEPSVSITAIGEALAALDREDQQLEAEIERLATQMRMYVSKRRILHDAVKNLLAKAGHVYKPKVWPTYPELHIED